MASAAAVLHMEQPEGCELSLPLQYMLLQSWPGGASLPVLTVL